MALFCVAFVRQQGGEFILRIEDTDQARRVEGAEESIFAMLRWLGLDWDEGPDVGGPYGPYRQSERLLIYQAHAEELIRGGHAYRCWCTPQRLAEVRAEQQQRKQPPRYDRFCLGKSADERSREGGFAPNPVIRLRMPDGETISFDDLVRGTIQFESDLIDDQVLIKSDGFPTYHLAAVVDDHLMEITHIVRGEEWISSTPKHLVLYDRFGWKPPRIAHLSLLRNVDRSKISKRKDPWANLPWFLDQGFLPEALLNFLALMGFSVPDAGGGTREVFGLDEFARAFDWERVGTTAPAFDLEKLTWLNGVYIRGLPIGDLVRRAGPFLAAAGIDSVDAGYVRRVVALEQERIHRMGEIGDLTQFFFQDPLTPDASALIPRGLTAHEASRALERATDLFAEARDLVDAAAMETRFRELVASLDMKAGQLFSLIRVAITGTTKSPPLFDTAVVLGPDRVARRLQRALAVLREAAKQERIAANRELIRQKEEEHRRIMDAVTPEILASLPTVAMDYGADESLKNGDDG